MMASRELVRLDEAQAFPASDDPRPEQSKWLTGSAIIRYQRHSGAIQVSLNVQQTRLRQRS